MTNRPEEWHGWVAPDLKSELLPVEHLFSLGDTVVKNTVREVRRIALPSGVFYLKRYFTIREGQPFRARLMARMKFHLRGGKALHVLHITQKMRDAGLGCPETVLALWRRSGAELEEVTLIRELIGTPCHILWKNESISHSSLLTQIAEGLRQFHQRGFFHGDCLAGNLCLDSDGKMSFLDNDRTYHTRFFCKCGVTRNLVQFCSHLWMHGEENECRAFLHAYFGEDDRRISPILRLWQKRSAQLRKEKQAKIAENQHDNRTKKAQS